MFYLGPFAKCKNEYTTTTTTKRGCIDPTCQLYHTTLHKDNFCSECGRAIEDFENEHVELLIDLFEMTGDECLFYDTDDKYIYYMPNKSRGATREMLFDRDSEGVVAITPNMMSEERDWFIVAFSQELDRVRKAYGDNFVGVYWGLVRLYD